MLYIKSFFLLSLAAYVTCAGSDEKNKNGLCEKAKKIFRKSACCGNKEKDDSFKDSSTGENTNVAGGVDASEFNAETQIDPASQSFGFKDGQGTRYYGSSSSGQASGSGQTNEGAEISEDNPIVQNPSAPRFAATIEGIPISMGGPEGISVGGQSVLSQTPDGENVTNVSHLKDLR